MTADGLPDELDALIRATAGPRGLLEILVRRFKLADPEAPLEELGEFLESWTAVWERRNAWLANLETVEPRVADARRAVEAAVETGDLDGADTALASAEAQLPEPGSLVEARRRAGLRRARADLLLLSGDADEAAAHFEAAAGFLLPFAPLEAASLRDAACGNLAGEGLRLGGTGVLRAIELGRRNEAIWTRAAHPEDWAMLQNKLGLALTELAERTDGPAASGLLAEAAAAFRGALSVWTPAAEFWGKTQVNLGRALAGQAAEAEPSAAAALLADAAAAYRAALEVFPEVTEPVGWAISQNFLGMALSELAERTDGQAGLPLLAQATAAHDAALRAYDEAKSPEDWAFTQFHLGRALSELGRRTDPASEVIHPASTLAGRPRRIGEPAGAGLLAGAEDAYRKALRFYSRELHPETWALAHIHIARTLVERADRVEGEAAAALFAAAATAFRAVREVRTREADPRGWAMVQQDLGQILEALGDLGDDPARRYAEGLACLDGALQVFADGDIKANWATCARSRARMARKLAAWPSAES
jgi:tetratricopeptide (TPR) repeat protein